MSSHGKFVKVAPSLGQTETAGGADKKLGTEMFFERVGVDAAMCRNDYF